jgi:hypothetical protein
VLAFALSASFVVGLAHTRSARTFASLHYPLYNAWINLSLVRHSRDDALGLNAVRRAGPGVGRASQG